MVIRKAFRLNFLFASIFFVSQNDSLSTIVVLRKSNRSIPSPRSTLRVDQITSTHDIMAMNLCDVTICHSRLREDCVDASVFQVTDLLGLGFLVLRFRLVYTSK